MAELSGAERRVKEHLEKIGAFLVKEHYNSFPTKYTIQYKDKIIIQPELELALVTLIEYLADRP
jgi:hypothetical protein